MPRRYYRAAAVLALAVITSLVATGPASAAAGTSSTTRGVSPLTVPGPSYKGLLNLNSGQCLTAPSTVNSSEVVQYPCYNYADQYWTSSEYVGADGGGDYYHLRNFNSGKCLVVQGTVTSTHAIQFTCSGYNDQNWYMVSAGYVYFQLKNRNSGKCLVVQGSNDNQPAIQAPCNSSYSDQLWYFG